MTEPKTNREALLREYHQLSRFIKNYSPVKKISPPVPKPNVFKKVNSGASLPPRPTSIHYNPTFLKQPDSKIHINPQFVRNNLPLGGAKDTPRVYINPNFIPPQPKVISEQVPVTFDTKKTPSLHALGESHWSKYKFIKPPSKTPLVEPSKPSINKNQRLLSKSKYKIVRKPLGDSGRKKVKSVIQAQILSRRRAIQRKVLHKLPGTLAKQKFKCRSRRVPKEKLQHRIVNIGGTIYKSSHNKLVRRSLGRIQNLLRRPATNPAVTAILAKQKAKRNLRSVYLKTAKLRKRKTHCAFFVRFGYCKGEQDGKCTKIHDPKKVSTCLRFLKGQCSMKDCKLTHNFTPVQAPQCHYFLLNGLCTNNDCFYLHVKLSPSAQVCENFLRGTCYLHQKCNHVHTYMCPDFFEKASCSNKAHHRAAHILTKSKMGRKRSHKKTERKKVSVPNPGNLKSKGEEHHEDWKCLGSDEDDDDHRKEFANQEYIRLPKLKKEFL